MNFRRIMLIFLVIFVFIDGFLFFSYNRSTVGDSSANGNNVLDEMRKDQISFSKPSSAVHEGYYFAASTSNDLRSKASSLQQQSYHFSGNDLISQFKQPITADNNGDLRKALDKTVANANMILHGDEYSYSRQLSNNEQMIYVQRVAKGPVYSKDAQLRFAVNDSHRVIGYSQSYLSGIDLLRERTKTISEERALTWLYQYNEIPNGTKVTWSNLAYTRLTDARGKQVYLPTWVFALKPNNSDTIVMKRVNAYTGEILKTGSTQSPSSNANSEILALT